MPGQARPDQARQGQTSRAPPLDTRMKQEQVLSDYVSRQGGGPIGDNPKDSTALQGELRRGEGGNEICIFLLSSKVLLLQLQKKNSQNKHVLFCCAHVIQM